MEYHNWRFTHFCCHVLIDYFFGELRGGCHTRLCLRLYHYWFSGISPFSGYHTWCWNWTHVDPMQDSYPTHYIITPTKLYIFRSLNLNIFSYLNVARVKKAFILLTLPSVLFSATAGTAQGLSTWAYHAILGPLYAVPTSNHVLSPLSQSQIFLLWYGDMCQELEII